MSHWRHFLCTAAFWLLGAAVLGAANAEIDRNGTLKYLDLLFTPNVIHGPEWTGAGIAPARIAEDGSRRSASHDVTIGSRSVGTLKWELREESPEKFSVLWKFGLSDSRIIHRFIDMMIPAENAGKFVVTCTDGKRETISFREQLRKKTPPIRSLQLSLKNGTEIRFTVTGAIFITVQDNRQWDPRLGYSIRFELAGESSMLEMKVQARFPKTFPVDISSAANRTFADDVPGDKKGGWTDQGSGNDMSCFTETEVVYKNIPFKIIDEKEHGRNSVIVVAGEVRDMAPGEITLTLPGGMNVRGISLLHATGWVETNKIGEIFVRYADTGTQTIPVTGGYDVGNWWVGGDFPNGKIAWSSSNAMRTVGLFASSFELGGAQPVSVTFRVTNPEAIWMIAGVTLTERPMLLPQHVARPWVAEANENWKPIRYSRRITPGSALDFSGFLPHKPAGKYGYARLTPDGKLAFENAPDNPIRMHGTNMGSDALFPPKEEAEKIAEFLAALGINTVRIHAVDRNAEFLPPSAPRSTTINPDNLDRLEYLIAQLKKRGIYLTTDLFACRQFRPGDNVEHLRNYKGMEERVAVQFNDDAFESWKEFCRNWLLHRNPYTGMTLAEDPALIFVNLSNEDTIGNEWNHSPGSPTQRFLADKYAAYCRKNPGVNPEPILGNSDFQKFIYEQTRKRSLEMMEFLRNELKTKFHITSANNGGNLASTWLRDTYDLVDEHTYQDHPMFPVVPWNYPMQLGQGSVINGHAWVPLLAMKSRIFGKPFVITEVDFCYPNMYRNEEGALLGAYGAFQNIDGFFYFSFGGSLCRVMNEQKRICVFESCYDPVKQQSYRLSAAYFLRGDVKPAQQKVSYTIPRNLFRKGQDFSFPKLNTTGLINQIGAVFDDRPIPGVMDHNHISDAEISRLYADYKRTGNARSATGELMIEPEAKIFRVATEKSASVTLPGNASGNAGKLTVADSNVFQTIAAISRDGKPLDSSDSVIVLQTTNLEVTGSRFADQDRRRQENPGLGELLLEHGTAEVSLKTDGLRRVAAVDFQGDELGEIPAEYRNGQLHFRADNFRYDGGIAGYHLTRK